MTTQDVVLEARNITKRFGGVTALDSVNLTLNAGEVLAVVGDNGAGKSTLIKCITGAMAFDEGEVLLGGERVIIDSPALAKQLGIETVYQDLALVNELNVTKNIFLGRERVRGSWLGRQLGLLDFSRMDREVKELFTSLDIEITDLHRDASAFSGGQRQAVALSRTVLFGKRVAVLDEPTAALGVRESANAMKLVGRLKEHGLAVIMITHDMRHVLDHCHRVSVLRLGRHVATRAVSDITGDELVGLITGATETEAA